MRLKHAIIIITCFPCTMEVIGHKVWPFRGSIHMKNDWNKWFIFAQILGQWHNYVKYTNIQKMDALSSYHFIEDTNFMPFVFLCMESFLKNGPTLKGSLVTREQSLFILEGDPCLLGNGN